MKKLWLILAVVLLCLPALASCNGFVNGGDILGGGGTVEETPSEQDNETAKNIETVVSGLTQSEVPLALPSDAVPITGATEITASGNYVLSGEITLSGSAQIKVSAKNVVLYFNGVTINKNGDKKVVNCKYDTVIVLVEGTSNTITTTYDDVDAIGSDKALTVLGKGALTLWATDDALSSEGALTVIGAKINATSSGGHALKGESVIIKDASITTNTADKDGVHAEIDYDGIDSAPLFTLEKGYVYIENSTLTATSSSGGDGISADTFVYILSGSFTIKTNGGAPATITETSSDNGEGKGIKAGAIDYTLSSDPNTEIDLTKGDYAIYILGGVFNINANDDAIHSDAYIFITGGVFDIASGDDAIHSELLLKISGKDTMINISKCYEGIESAKVEISGGTITLTSTDDGINAADGTENIPGKSNSNCYIIISGGTITVNSGGDGVDSNGTVLISGGTLNVHGSTSGADASLDSDGGILVTGGDLFALGSYAMVETPAKNSTQYVVSFASQSNIAAGTNLSLVNSDGETILMLTAVKSCRSVIISSEQLKKGETYYIYGGSTKLAAFTVSSIITTVGTSSSTTDPGGRPR